MNHAPHAWTTGDVIPAVLLNNLEQDLAAAAVVADIPTAGTPTGDALRAAYEGHGLPVHAGSRTARFNQHASVYNLKASNTRRLRAALSAARAGTGLCRLAFAGDSLTAGYQVTRGTSDPVTFLRNELTRQGFTTGELVNPYTNGATPDTRFQITTQGGVQFPWGGLNNGATATLTGSGTTLEIVGSGSAQGFTVSVDGGAAITFTPNGSSGPQVLTITGLSNASHSAVITCAAGAASNAYIYSAGFRQATGVVVQNAGIVASSTSDWLAGGSFGPAATLFSTVAPIQDAVFIELGANNLLQPSGTVSSFRTDLGNLIDQARAQTTGNPATVILVTSNYPSNQDTGWPPFVSAAYDVADSKDAPLIDYADRLGLFSAYGSSQGSGDGIHLNPAGTAHKARAWWNSIAT